MHDVHGVGVARFAVHDRAARVVRVQMGVNDQPDVGRIGPGDPERLLERRVLGPGTDRGKRTHTRIDQHKTGGRSECERVDVPGPRVLADERPRVTSALSAPVDLATRHLV
jgi:hypothetical protein